MNAKCLICLAVLAWLPAPAQASNKDRPNIILLFADDLGYGDVGCYGAKGFKTPNLDRMAAEGLRFTSFYTGCSVCTGSRAALMTGRHYQRVGVPAVMFPNHRTGLNPNEITIAAALSRLGYFTAIVGKWHLGHLPRYLPTRHGFDSYFGIPYSNDMSIDPENVRFAKGAVFREGKTEQSVRTEKPPKNKVPLMRGEEVIEYPADLTTLTKRYTREVVRLIEENKSKPFFLYVPHTMPHVPLAVSADFKGRTKTLFGDVMEELDGSVGEILKAVRDAGLDGKTMVLFTSDNGAHQGSAAPLRGKKATLYEGGFRVPCIARWPGKVPAKAVSDEIAATVDLLPTLVKLGGGKAPADRPIDGKDIGPLLLGEKGAKSPHEHYVLLHGNGAVRSGSWKFYPWPEGLAGKGKGKDKVKAKPKEGPKVQLYDLAKDLAETTNVAEKHPDVVKRLSEVFDRFREDVKKNKLPLEKERGK